MDKSEWARSEWRSLIPKNIEFQARKLEQFLSVTSDDHIIFGITGTSAVKMYKSAITNISGLLSEQEFLNQSDAGDFINKSRQTINKMFNDKAKMTLMDFISLCGMLNVTAEQALGTVDPEDDTILAYESLKDEDKQLVRQIILRLLNVNEKPTSEDILNAMSDDDRQRLVEFALNNSSETE